MKNLIRKILKEEFQEENEKLWEVRMDMFDGVNDYNKYLNMLEIYNQIKDKKGFTGIKVHGNLDLVSSKIKSLENITEVLGFLDLSYTKIESLGNLKSVGSTLFLVLTPLQSLENLKYVDRDLILPNSKIELLGDLRYVGGNLDIRDTPLTYNTTYEEIRNKIDVVGNIFKYQDGAG